MKRLKATTFLVFLLAISSFAFAPLPPKSKDVKAKGAQAHFRSDCASAQATAVLEINNVRARLSTAGDSWWNGGYIVPAIPQGSTDPPVAAIFAGSLWVGGIDEGGNIKMAAQTYGHELGLEEFWPGLLNSLGEAEAELCSNWDRFFKVNRNSIDIFRANWNIAWSEGRTELDPEEIPDDIKAWPSLGNPFFEEIHGFRLPGLNQENIQLADFWDVGGSPGKYEPQFGDFPILSIPKCDFSVPLPSPDEMIFSITNDGGGIHSNSSGDPIGMEIHTTVFAYQTDDEINDMSFYKYKMVNRAIETINDTYMGIWMDPDLGCYSDDYVGCDSTRNLGYVYNADDLDGRLHCEDCEGMATYCTEIPVLGLDFFRTPLGATGEELGMNSFTYQLSNVLPDPVPEFDAQSAYHTLSGKWPDGTPMTYGGNGYDLHSTAITNFAFPDAPNDENGWSMCQENFPFEDRRTTQATGPFTLKPGAINTLVAGLVWVPNLSYPCPDLKRFFEADDKAQALFDNCFDIALNTKPEKESLAEINIYPNPYSLSSGVPLQIEPLPAAAFISIFDIQGRLLLQSKKESSFSIDILEELGFRPNPGTYIIQLKAKGIGVQTNKFIITE